MKIIKWVCFCVGFFITLGTQAAVVGIIIFLAGFLFIKRGPIVKGFDSTYNAAVQRYRNYLDQLVESVGNKIFSTGFRWFRWYDQYMLYCNEGMIFVDINQDLIVAYNKSDIKEVNKERVHTGSHTTSNTTGVGVGTAKTTAQTGMLGGSFLRSNGIGVNQARTNADTTDFYEWHFDVLTDYLTYPKVSMIIEDSRSNEDMLNEAYAILKP